MAIKRYRVESKKSNVHHFRSDCTKEDLEYFKALCKYDSIKSGVECYYREFPVTKNKKVYYAKDNPNMTVEELAIISKRIRLVTAQ